MQKDTLTILKEVFPNEADFNVAYNIAAKIQFMTMEDLNNLNALVTASAAFNHLGLNENGTVSAKKKMMAMMVVDALTIPPTHRVIR